MIRARVRHSLELAADPVNFNDPGGLTRCYVNGERQDGNGTFAYVTCLSNDGQLVGDQTLAISKMADEKEQWRVLADAAATFKGFDPNDWDLVPAAASRAIQALSLNSECFDLFGSSRNRPDRWNPITVITSMFLGRSSEYGTVDFDYHGVGAAETRPSGRILPSPFNRNLIQSTRANISIHRNVWNIGNTDENAETILHELAHLYNFSRGSGGFAIGNLAEGSDPFAFDKIIKEKCKLP